jgi:hypothetical protein
MVTVAEALQALVEALQPFSELLPQHRRSEFAKTLGRVRASRVHLMAWVDERR